VTKQCKLRAATGYSGFSGAASSGTTLAVLVWQLPTERIHSGQRSTLPRRTLTRLSPEDAMLRWALLFLIIAIIAGVLGLGVVGGTAAWIARVLFVVFIVLFLIGLLTGRRPPVV
jgi:uncharacterized membrane protein YtjA (UPF0391 family)